MLPLLVLVAGLGLVPKPPSPAPGPVSFTASDGVTIYANSYVAQSPTAPVILLFHQAQSSKNEYAPIAPQLVSLGYNVIAIDQRSGGDLYPPANETVQHLGKSADYIDVLPDMDAALDYAKRTYPNSPVYAWGSSYSAALVFAFAAKHPKDIAAVIAFSPGACRCSSTPRAPRAKKLRRTISSRFSHRTTRRISCRRTVSMDRRRCATIAIPMALPKIGAPLRHSSHTCRLDTETRTASLHVGPRAVAHA